MSTKARTSHPVGRAALGLAALVAIVVLANWLVALTATGSKGIDFTENRVHTLSDGTRAILQELDAPVTIRYYATRSSQFVPREFQLHMRRVDDLLREYASIAEGKLRIEHLDPQPDTDAEDAANLDGIRGQRLTEDDNFFFGMAVTSLDQTAVIPFLDPAEETMLEYQLSRAIAQVSQPKKPLVAVLSGLPLAGRAPTMPGQPPAQPWIIYQQLAQGFEIRDLEESVTEIDPEEIDVLLLVHPTDLPEPAQRAIDRYVRGGGTVIACLDAYSVTAQMLGGNNPMMGPHMPTASLLPTLLDAWGVSFESGGVVADAKYRVQLQDGRIALGLLTLTQEAMPDPDSVLTQGLTDLYLVLPGGFRTEELPEGLTANPLVRSSGQAGVVDSMRASQIDQSLLTRFSPTGETYDFVLHLSGRFPAAFAEAETEEPTETTETPPAAEGNVFLIADVDFIYDNFAYRTQDFGGTRIASPFNGNSSLLLNMVDQATGSRHLIGARSRASTFRPFTVVKEMEAAFEQELGRTIAELEERQQETMRRLEELQSQRRQSDALFLSPEQEAEIRELRAEQVEYSRRIREEQKALRSQKDALSSRMFLLNVVLVPALVAVFGLGLFLRRRAATGAR